MKLDMPEVELEKSAVFETQMFGIGDEVVIMEILRSRMYSIPQKTVVQEYLSNARDANREVGNDKRAIEVTLPDDYNNLNWSVRDFGLGITPDRMANVFVKYGCSTKRNDENQTGGFGLGAKSAFALSDNFTIESITDETGQKIKRTYVAVIDKSNKGELNLISEENTTEERGTKIIVPVTPDDKHLFIEYTKEVADFWDIHPIIMNDENFEWTEPKYLYRKDNEYSFNYNNRYGHPIICLDGIPYPLNDNVIKDHDRFYSQDWIFYFKTGELRVTSNRESLDYKNPNTAKLINEKYEAAKKEISIILLKKVQDAPTLKQAKIEYHQLRANLNIKEVTLWKDIEIDDDAILMNAEIESIKPNTWYRKGSRKRLNSNNEFEIHNGNSIDLLVNSIIVLNDEGNTDHRAKYRTLFEKGFQKIQLINNFGEPKFDANGAQTNLDEIKNNYELSMQAGLKYIEVVKLSTVEKKKEDPVYRSTTAMVRKLCAHHSYHSKDVFEATSLNVSKDAGVYAVTNLNSRKECTIFTYDCDWHSLAAIKKFLELDELYIVNCTTAKRMGKGWVSVEDKLREKVNGYNAQGIGIEEPKHILSMELNDSKYKILKAAILKNFNKDSYVSLAYKYFTMSEALKGASKTITCNIHCIKSLFTVKCSDLETMRNDFFKKYPMLNLEFDRHYITVDEIAQYIKMKDCQDCAGLSEVLCYS